MQISKSKTIEITPQRPATQEVSSCVYLSPSPPTTHAGHLPGRSLLVWRDLHYTVPQARSWLKDSSSVWNPLKKLFGSSKSDPDDDSLFRSDEKVILNSMCGTLESGQLMGVMGASGAGKSCLLKILAGQYQAASESRYAPDVIQRRRSSAYGACSGIGASGIRFYAGGQKRNLAAAVAQDLRVALIPQDDFLTAELTVRETVEFASRLKNYTFKTRDQHEELISKVTSKLGLSHILNSRVGQCSGGERRRISIACELMSKPDLLLLDEPTSGLDSRNAISLIGLLRDLAESEDMLIVTSIHQPSAKMLNLFHKLYVMATCQPRLAEAALSGQESPRKISLHGVYSKEMAGGGCIYEGPPDQLVPYLKAQAGPDYGVKLPPFCNPADWVIDLASGEQGTDLVDWLMRSHRQQWLAFNKMAAAGDTRRPSTGFGSSMSLNTGSQDSLSASPNGLDLSPDPAGRSSPSHDVSMNGSKDTLKISFREDHVDMGIPLADLLAARSKKKSSSKSSFPFFAHFLILTRRTWLKQSRDNYIFLFSIFVNTVLPLFLAALYGKSGRHDGCPSDESRDKLALFLHHLRSSIIQDKKSIAAAFSDQEQTERDDKEDFFITAKRLSDNYSLIIFSLFGGLFSSLFTSVLAIPLEVRTVNKEWRNGWYGLWSYFAAHSVAVLPMLTLGPALSMALLFPLTSQWIGWDRALIAYGFYLLMALNCQSLGVMIGTLFLHTPTTATYAAIVGSFPLCLTTGFFNHFDSMNVVWKAAFTASWFRQSFVGLIYAVYGARCQACNFKELSFVDEDEKEALYGSDDDPPAQTVRRVALMQMYACFQNITVLDSQIDRLNLLSQIIHGIYRRKADTPSDDVFYEDDWTSDDAEAETCPQPTPIPIDYFNLDEATIPRAFAICLASFVVLKLAAGFVLQIRLKKADFR